MIFDGFNHLIKEDTLTLLKGNSAQAVAAIRALSDEELDRAAPVALHSFAPLTAQYFIEEHPLSHSYHHLAIIQAAINHKNQSNISLCISK